MKILILGGFMKLKNAVSLGLFMLWWVISIAPFIAYGREYGGLMWAISNIIGGIILYPFIHEITRYFDHYEIVPILITTSFNGAILVLLFRWVWSIFEKRVIQRKKKNIHFLNSESDQKMSGEDNKSN